MFDSEKEHERAELHRTIWGIANDLRGSVDGWDFKQYVLDMLFYRYISENLTTYINIEVIAEIEHIIVREEVLGWEINAIIAEIERGMIWKMN